MAYVDFLKECASREKLIQLAVEIDSYAGQKQPGQSSVVEFSGSVIQQLLELAEGTDRVTRKATGSFQRIS
jgi:hypothetical protein